MNTVSISPAASDKARLQGVALASVIIALMLSLLLEALDQTIVGTAMPRIISRRNSSRPVPPRDIWSGSTQESSCLSQPAFR